MQIDGTTVNKELNELRGPDIVPVMNDLDGKVGNGASGKETSVPVSSPGYLRWCSVKSAKIQLIFIQVDCLRSLPSLPYVPPKCAFPAVWPETGGHLHRPCLWQQLRHAVLLLD